MCNISSELALISRTLVQRLSGDGPVFPRNHPLCSVSVFVSVADSISAAQRDDECLCLSGISNPIPCFPIQAGRDKDRAFVLQIHWG